MHHWRLRRARIEPHILMQTGMWMRSAKVVVMTGSNASWAHGCFSVRHTHTHTHAHAHASARMRPKPNTAVTAPITLKNLVLHAVGHMCSSSSCWACQLCYIIRLALTSPSLDPRMIYYGLCSSPAWDRALLAEHSWTHTSAHSKR